MIGSLGSGTNTFGMFNGSNTNSITDSTQITATPVFTHNSVVCSGTPTSYYVVVNPIPTVNTVNPQTVCHNDNVKKIVFTGSTTQQGVFYEWQNINSTDIGYNTYADTNKIPQYVGFNKKRLPITANFRVTPKFTHNLKTCIGAFLDFTVTVNPNPSLPTILNMPTDICTNTKYHNFKCQVVDFPKANEGTITYNWTVNGNSAYVQDTSNYQDNSINYGGAILSFGTDPKIKIKAVLPTGCYSVDSFVVTFKSTPSANTDSMIYPVFYYDASKNFVCANNTPISYLWGCDDKKLNAYPRTTETQQNYYYNTPLNTTDSFYWVKTTNALGCISKSYYNKPHGRGIIIYPTPNNSDLSVKLYPNPTTTSIKLSWNNTIWNDDILVTVTNVLGKIEMQKLVEKQLNTGSITLNTIGLSSGLYFVSLSNKGENKGSIKFIKQ